MAEGIQGKTGASAYELAVANGFVGTQAEWLATLKGIAGQNGAFGGRMLTININPFSYETTKNYLNQKAPEIKLDDDAIERFYKCTSGIPSYINIFARQLPINQYLSEKDIINVFDNNIALIASHFINEWNRLTLKEKDIIIALIDSPLKRVDLARKLNVKSGSLSDKLNKINGG